MIKKIGFILIAMFLGSVAQACIWYQGEPAYWPSSTVPVCFTNLNQSERHRSMAQAIQRTLSEISDRTAFQLTGFNECQSMDTGTPQISINLDANRAIGQASGNFQGGMSEFPNVFVPMDPSLDQTFTLGQTIHEVLHMFGIQHAHEHYQERDFGPRSPYRQGGEYYFFGDYDANSVMVRTGAIGYNPPAPGQGWLTDADVQCLNHIASGDFPNQPGVRDLEAQYEHVRNNLYVPPAAPLIPVEEEKGDDPNAAP